jgi:hypothetical protein
MEQPLAEDAAGGGLVADGYMEVGCDDNRTW